MDEHQQILDFEQVRNLLSNPSTENWFYLIQFLTITQKKQHYAPREQKDNFDDFNNITKPYILQHLNDWPPQFKYAILPTINPPTQRHPKEQEHVALEMASTLVLTQPTTRTVQSFDPFSYQHQVQSIHWQTNRPHNTNPNHTNIPNINESPYTQHITAAPIMATPHLVFDKLTCIHEPPNHANLTGTNNQHLAWLQQPQVAKNIQHIQFRNCTCNEAFLWHEAASNTPITFDGRLPTQPTHFILPPRLFGLSQILHLSSPSIQSITFDNCTFNVNQYRNVWQRFCSWTSSRNLNVTLNQSRFFNLSDSSYQQVTVQDITPNSIGNATNITINPRIPHAPLTYHPFV